MSLAETLPIRKYPTSRLNFLIKSILVGLLALGAGISESSGLELGADDYVVKPFSPREVVARIGAILKRAVAKPAMAAPALALARGLLHLEPEGWHTQWAGQDVGLTAKEFQLLQILAATPSKVFSRDEIIDRLHGPGFAITDRTIDSHIRHIGQKFSAIGAQDVIETRAGIGYRIGVCLGRAA